MTLIQKSLLLASAMIGIAILGVFELVPSGFAEWAPLGLLMFLPATLSSSRKCCGVGR